MPAVDANGIRIEYETFGEPLQPALLLIAGCGAQMLFWDLTLCRMLAAAGFFVIRFDNRDVGLSTKFDAAGTPDFPAAMRDVMAGKPITSAYTLEDMADDAVGLLQALGIGKAHICGASMGGMIAQVLACRHPQRVLSLTSIMSCTGNPELPQGRPEALAAVIAPAPQARAAYIEHMLNVWRKIWSPGFPFETQRARTFVAQSYDRAYCPQGMARQNMAVLRNGDRRAALSALRVPSLVIHGSADPLIPLAGGRDTAQSIAGAKLLLIDGMGHDLPEATWPDIVAAIAAQADAT